MGRTYRVKTIEPFTFKRQVTVQVVECEDGWREVQIKGSDISCAYDGFLDDPLGDIADVLWRIWETCSDPDGEVPYHMADSWEWMKEHVAEVDEPDDDWEDRGPDSGVWPTVI